MAKCCIQFLKLTKGEPKIKKNKKTGKMEKPKHTAKADGVIKEAFKERYTKSVTFDKSRIYLNEYESIYDTDSGYDISDEFDRVYNNARTKVNTKNGTVYRKIPEDSAVIGCAILINPSFDMSIGWNEETYKKFYEDSEEFLYQLEYKNRHPFRKENKFASAIHRDEGHDEDEMSIAEHGNTINEHKHDFYYMKDENGSFNLGNLIETDYFNLVNEMYPKFMRERGWDIEDCEIQNDGQNGGKSVNEHIVDKATRQAKENKKLERNNKKLNNDIKSLKEELEETREALHAEKEKPPKVIEKPVEVVKVKTVTETVTNTVTKYKDNPEDKETIKRLQEALEAKDKELRDEKEFTKTLQSYSKEDSEIIKDLENERDEYKKKYEALLHMNNLSNSDFESQYDK